MGIGLKPLRFAGCQFRAQRVYQVIAYEVRSHMLLFETLVLGCPWAAMNRATHSGVKGGGCVIRELGSGYGDLSVGQLRLLRT